MDRQDRYNDFIENLINETPDFMVEIKDDEKFILLDRLVLELNERAMTWLVKIYLQENYKILKDDELTDYIKEKYQEENMEVLNSNGNLFLNKSTIKVILKELDENDQLTYEEGKFRLK